MNNLDAVGKIGFARGDSSQEVKPKSLKEKLEKEFSQVPPLEGPKKYEMKPLSEAERAPLQRIVAAWDAAKQGSGGKA